MTDKLEVDRADLEALLEAWDDDGTHGWFNEPLRRLRKRLEPPRCTAKWHPGPGTSQWGCWKAKGHDGDHRVDPTCWTEPVEP